MTIPRCLDPDLIVPISRGTTEIFKTGSWSVRHPVHREKTSPCRAACPVGNDPARALALAARGDFDAALAVFLEETPLPLVCGSVCYQPCQGDCNRAHWDGAVPIRALERAVAEQGSAQPARLSSQGQDKPVAIIGSGPAGLAAAYHLARLGHPVTVFEADSKPGGMLRRAIPAYRLPDGVLENDLARMVELDIEFKTNQAINPEDIPGLLAEFKAVFLACGAGEALGLDLPGVRNRGVMTGLDFLIEVRSGRIKELPGRVIVIGGGNVAVDAALSALRLGAARVEMVSLEAKGQLPAHDAELAQARSEGVEVIPGWGPVEINGLGKSEGGVEFVRCISVFDDTGRFKPVYDTNQTMNRRADWLILAVGQQGGAARFINSDLAAVDPTTLASAIPGLYVGGDALTGPASVAQALGAGKRAAAAIHLETTQGQILGRTLGQTLGQTMATTLLGAGPAFSITALFKGRADWEPGSVVGFKDIEPVFLDIREPGPIPELNPAERQGSFLQIETGLNSDQARDEAGRCFNCGVCVACDSCFVFCPDDSIQRPAGENGPYVSDPDYCKGCGVCVTVCTRGVIGMEDKR